MVRGGMLDLMRFLASIFILTYHYGDAAPVPLSGLHPALERGYLATDFFLVLSGYVLSRAYGGVVTRGEVGAGAFLAKRWSRVWPAHLIMLAGLVLLILISGAFHIAPRRPDWFLWSDLPSQIFLLQSLGVPGGAGWNLPTWTMSALLVCYGLFPFIWRLQAKIRSPYLVLAAAAAVTGLCALFARIALGETINGAALHFGLMRAFPMFLLGLAVARLVEDQVVPPRLSTAVGLVGLVVFVGTELVIGRHDLLSLAAIVAIVFGVASRPVSRPSRAVAYGAEMSFSVYITHTLWGTLWFGAYHYLQGHERLSVGAQWAFWSAGVILGLGFAWLFYQFVDQPLQTWLRPKVDGWLRPRPTRYQAPSPSA